jgi:hypothetical protein
MVVVTHAVLIERSAAGGFDPSSQANTGERAQHVVHRLG